MRHRRNRLSDPIFAGALISLASLGCQFSLCQVECVKISLASCYDGIVSNQTSKPAPLIGRRLARIRSDRGLTQGEAARLYRTSGLAWTRAQVAALESGRRDDLNLGELALLSHALTLPLVELLPDSGDVSLSDHATTTVGALRAWAAGGTMRGLRVTAWDQSSAAEIWNDRMAGRPPSEAELRAARRLGRTWRRVARMAAELWDGRSLDEERDRRLAAAGQPPTAAYRGHITRALLVELREGFANVRATTITPPPQRRSSHE